METLKLETEYKKKGYPFTRSSISDFQAGKVVMEEFTLKNCTALYIYIYI